MDEQAERAKLELLDLTEDVIELILEKKRKSYDKMKQEVPPGPSRNEAVPPEPPSVVLTEPLQSEAIIDVIPEPTEELVER